MKWNYKRGHYHNWSPVSNRGLCMDVYWGKNRDGQRVIAWSCHNGWNQRFEVNYNVRKPVYRSTGLAANRPFMIKSRMAGGKVLYWWDHLGGGQYQMSLRKPRYE
jgi:hypothetical protein